MGYRFWLVICACVLLGSCAAFDSSSTPYEGFSKDEVPPPKGQGIYTGYYSGEMTVDSNSCESVQDKVGAKVPIEFDVYHKDNAINVVFKEATAAGELSGEKVTIMTDTMKIKHFYFLNFAEGKIEGSCQVVEPDANGQYGKECATYKFSMKKGEKKAEEKKPEEKKPKT